jgi:hypothetical protein
MPPPEPTSQRRKTADFLEVMMPYEATRLAPNRLRKNDNFKFLEGCINTQRSSSLQN